MKGCCLGSRLLLAHVPSPGVALTSWSQIVTNAPAIIDVFQTGKRQEKMIVEGGVPKGACKTNADVRAWLRGHATHAVTPALPFWV